MAGAEGRRNQSLFVNWRAGRLAKNTNSYQQAASSNRRTAVHGWRANPTAVSPCRRFGNAFRKEPGGQSGLYIQSTRRTQVGAMALGVYQHSTQESNACCTRVVSAGHHAFATTSSSATHFPAPPGSTPGWPCTPQISSGRSSCLLCYRICETIVRMMTAEPGIQPSAWTSNISIGVRLPGTKHSSRSPRRPANPGLSRTHNTPSSAASQCLYR